VTDWDAAGWAGARTAQEDAWLATTPEQRLAWLEDAVAFVRAIGRVPSPPAEVAGEEEDTVAPA